MRQRRRRTGGQHQRMAMWVDTQRQRGDGKTSWAWHIDSRSTRRITILITITDRKRHP
jgi:hypothetical protein